MLSLSRRLVASFTIVCVLAPMASLAAAPQDDAPNATIVQGFQAKVYTVVLPALEASPAPVPTLERTCGTAFPKAALPAAEPLKDSGYWLLVGNESEPGTCRAAMMTPVTGGLQFDFVIVRPKPARHQGDGANPEPSATPGPNKRPQYTGDFSTTADLTFKGEDFVEFRICPRTPQPCPHEEIVVRIDPNDRTVASQGGRIEPSILPKVAPIEPAPTCAWVNHDPVAACLRNGKQATTVSWARSVVVPWAAFGLHTAQPPKTAYARIIYHKASENGAPSEIAEGQVQMHVKPAFIGVFPQPDPTLGADDHRYFAMTGYDRYISPTVTPPPKQQVVLGSSPTAPPTTVTLPKATHAQAVPERFPPITADVSTPITQDLALTGTISQNNGTVKAVQRAISSSVSAEAFPSPNPLPSITCKSCGTFQSLNASYFGTLTGSGAGIKLPSSSLGSEDVPFDLSTLGDLYAGGAVSVSNGSTTWSALRTQLNNQSPLAFTDTALAMTQQNGSAAWSIIGASVARPQAQAQPAQSGAPSPPPTTITIPYLTSYAVAAKNDHVTRDNDAQTVNDFTTFGRFAYDQTDHAGNFFGAFREQYTVLHQNDNQFVATLILGYRGVGRNYNELDGAQTSLPTVSGPLAMVDLASGAFDLRLSGNSYYSGTDLATGRDLKASWQAGKQFSIFYDANSFRQTAPLLAVNTLSAQLGDVPFQGAVNELDPTQRGTTFGGHDQQAGLSYKLNLSRYRTIPSISASVGFDFDNVAPSCNQHFTTLSGLSPKPEFVPIISCRDGIRKESVDLGASLVVHNLVIGGSYTPSLQGGQSSSAGSYTYNAVLAYAPTACDTLIVTTSNKQGALSTGTIGQVSSGFQAEFDHEGRVRFLHKFKPTPTLFVGYSNTFAYQQANYQTPTMPPQLVSLPYPTRNYELYLGIRYGNPSFLKTVSPGCSG